MAEGIWVDLCFPAKSYSRNYVDFYDKVTVYARLLSRYGKRIDPTTKAQTAKLIFTVDPHDPFVYMEQPQAEQGSRD